MVDGWLLKILSNFPPTSLWSSSLSPFWDLGTIKRLSQGRSFDAGFPPWMMSIALYLNTLVFLGPSSSVSIGGRIVLGTLRLCFEASVVRSFSRRYPIVMSTLGPSPMNLSYGSLTIPRRSILAFASSSFIPFY